MDTGVEPPVTASRNWPVNWRSVGYWLATVVVGGEMLLGGSWDIARLPFVADLVAHLGYPSYFLVLLGSWKVLAPSLCSPQVSRCSRNGPMRAPSLFIPGRSFPIWSLATTWPRSDCWPSSRH